MDGTPHEVRLRLLANGYEPLPLQGKSPSFKGWSHVEITADFLAKFRRSTRFKNTGLRCGGQSRLIGIDIDVDDPAVVGDILAALSRSFIDTQFVRIGRAPRAMLLFRLSSGQPMIAKLRSGVFADVKPDDDLQARGYKERNYAVEVIGECHQMAAFGIHPDTEQSYTWPQLNPADHALQELPEITTEQLRAVTRIADDIFEDYGLAPTSNKRSADNEGLLSDAYDLTDDMLFTCREEESGKEFNATVTELEELLRDSKGGIELRCCCSPFREGADNVRTGQIRLTDNGLLITDYATFVRHRRLLPDLVGQLADNMQAAGVATPPIEKNHDSVKDGLRWHFEKNQNAALMQTAVMNAAYLPDVRRTPAGRPQGEQLPTIENLEFILRACDVRAEYDMMRKRFEIIFPPDIDCMIHSNDPDNRTNLLASYLQDFASVTFGIGVTNFKKQLELLSTGHQFHPIEEWILSAEWDGTDRIGQLAATIPTDDPLWDVYLRKWLIQAIEAWAGWHDGTEQKAQVLVIVGEQGKRKTTWISRLAPPIPLACVTGESVHMDYQSAARDTMARVLQHGMVELGELETTFKRSDSGALKNFLSRPVDRFRRAYGEGELTWPRTTVFIASVNIADVLDDPTGARRFWPIRLRQGAQCDTDHKIDLQQLWRQAYELWADKAPWWLEGDEVDLHNRSIFDNFMRPTEARDALESKYGAAAALRRSHRLDDYEGMTVSEIALACGLPRDKATMGEISAWMTRRFGERRKVKGRKGCFAVPVATRGLRVVKGKQDGDVS